MTWRVSYGLDKLLQQINAVAPWRDKASDGSIGDASHQGTVSDHNPDAQGIVRARDYTQDPGHGADMAIISEAIRRSRDPRVAYVIFNRRIFSATNAPWTWRSYSGSDPHTGHMHVSTVKDNRVADGTQPWAIALPSDTPTEPAHEMGDTMQSFIRWTGSNAVIFTDGVQGRWVKSEAEMADIKTLAAEGTLSLGYGGSVRVVGNRDLVGQIIGDRPAEWANVAPAGIVSVELDDAAVTRIAEALVAHPDTPLGDADKPVIIAAVQDAIRGMISS